MNPTASAKPDTTLPIGMVLKDKWVILEAIGKGGMGEVYRAHQLNLNRDVAIKVISHDFLHSVSDNEYELENSLERFRREVQVMAQVRHPNVLQIYDHDSAMVDKGDETVVLDYIAMEYIAGGATLRDTMSEEGFYPDEELMKQWLPKYYLPLLDGMQALHERGIVHRDLKPENILLDGAQPKIADFGLARSSRLKPITQSMDVKGTPPYMSPEHFMDLKRTDQRTDIYALGKILYEAAAGRMGPNQIPFKRAQLDHATSPFFKRLDAIIQKATDEDRDRRYPNVDALAQAIADLLAAPVGKTLEGAPPAKPPGKEGIGRSLLWGLALLLVVMMGAVGVHFYHPTSFQRQVPGPPRPSASTPGDASSQQETLERSDFDLMHRIPGGTLLLPKDFGTKAGTTIQLKAFYMNEALVTNQQYVNFLNAVLPRITVQASVVQGDGQIWLMLGEVVKGYEPIVFRNGRFYVKNSLHTACPVVRVTPYGAQAYVDHYGFRLPTEREWLWVAQRQARRPRPASQASGWRSAESWMMNEMAGSTSTTRTSGSADKEKSLPIHTPVTVFEPNSDGLRGINKNLGEWTTRSLTADKKEYVVMGWPSETAADASAIPSGIARKPWEAFEEVSFRCASDSTDEPPQPGMGEKE